MSEIEKDLKIKLTYKKDMVLGDYLVEIGFGDLAEILAPIGTSGNPLSNYLIDQEYTIGESKNGKTYTYTFDSENISLTQSYPNSSKKESYEMFLRYVARENQKVKSML